MSTYNVLNFPDKLKIAPSVKKGDHVEGIFATSDRQMKAIEKYGIAGRVWEASYLLASYLSNGTHGCSLRGHSEEDSSLYPDVEYDPNWPFDREESDVTFGGVFQGLETSSVENGAYGGGSSMPLTHGRQQQQQHSEKGTHASKSSLDYPEVVLELGSGMGSVGLVAVEGLAIQYSTANSAISRPHQNQDLGPSDHDGTTKKGDAHAEKTARGSTVILTDLPEVSTLMEENVRMQMEEWEKRRLDNIIVDVKNDDQRGAKPIVNLKVRSLAWGNSSHVRSISEELRTQRGFDAREEPCHMHILCSDLVYFPHLLAPLLRTLIQLTSPGFISDDSPRASIIISYRVRSLEKETPFWQAFGVWFRFRPVLAKRRVRPGNSRSNQTAATLSAIGQTEQTGEETEEMMKGDGESGEGWRRVGWDESALSFLFIATRKPETMDWKCPDDDHELLHSRHHPAASGDDTFESLLLLCNEAVD